MILHHLLQLRAVGAFAAHTVNVNLIHPQALHQYLLPDGVLLLGTDTDISYLQKFHLQIAEVPIGSDSLLRRIKSRKPTLSGLFFCVSLGYALLERPYFLFNCRSTRVQYP